MPKPYTIYRSGPSPEAPETPGSAGEGQAPPRGPRQRTARSSRRPQRRRRVLLLLIATIVALAITAGAAVALLHPFGVGKETAAGAPRVRRSTSAGVKPTSSSPSPSVAATAANPPAVTVVGGGDVIGDRNVRNVLAQYGSGLFRGIAPFFKKADFGFVNLETPLTHRGDPQSWKDVVFKGDPRLAPAMASSGINVVTLANNHGGDQGDVGILDSITYTRRAGISLVGAGKNLAAAQRAAVLEKNGAKVAFLGFTDVLPPGYPATATSPGTSPGRANLNAVKRAIGAGAKRADYTFVAWHWNLEFTTAPSWLESSEGKAAIDAGADVVFAHHPHVLQGVQAYHGGLIFYSLGDLVFDNVSGPMAQTILARTKVSPKAIDATLIPVQIAGSGIPSVATGADGLSILRRVKTYSASLGTTVRIRGGKGYVHVNRR